MWENLERIESGFEAMERERVAGTNARKLAETQRKDMRARIADEVVARGGSERPTPLDTIALASPPAQERQYHVTHMQASTARSATASPAAVKRSTAAADVGDATPDTSKKAKNTARIREAQQAGNVATTIAGALKDLVSKRSDNTMLEVMREDMAMRQQQLREDSLRRDAHAAQLAADRKRQDDQFAAQMKALETQNNTMLALMMKLIGTAPQPP